MIDYLKTHEQMMRNRLSTAETKKEIDEILLMHEIKVGYFQHERLVHLMVTLCFGIGLFVSVYATMALGHPFLYLVDILLCTLFVPYIFHYRGLENGVQRLYKLGDEIRKKKENLK